MCHAAAVSETASARPAGRRYIYCSAVRAQKGPTWNSRRKTKDEKGQKIKTRVIKICAVDSVETTMLFFRRRLRTRQTVPVFPYTITLSVTFRAILRFSRPTAEGYSPAATNPSPCAHSTTHTRLWPTRIAAETAWYTLISFAFRGVVLAGRIRSGASARSTTQR